MPISDVIADFQSKFEAAKAELTSVNANIEALECRRREIERAAPHTDDIVAVFRRGQKEAEEYFSRTFASYLNETFCGSDAAARATVRSREDILRLKVHDQSPGALVKGPTRVELPDFNTAVLALLLGDEIAKRIPGLIDQLCPGARAGMKQADRQAALQEIDTELSRLRAEAEALQADLGAARKAVR